MKSIFKIERDENSIAKWDTFHQRLAFTLNVVVFLVFVPIVFFTFTWVSYWLFTGKNIFTRFLNNPQTLKQR